MSFWGTQLSYQSVGGDVLRLDADTVSSILAGGPSTAGFRLNSDGGVYFRRDQVSGGAYVKQYDWVLPNTSAADYECTWTVGTNTVDTTPGAAGTWLALTASRTWEETNASAFENCSFTVRIRKVGTTDETTAVINMDVDGSP